MELFGPFEISQTLGVSRQRVVQLAAREDFPAPVAILQMGKVWLADDIRRWAEEQGRDVKPLPMPPGGT